MDDGIGEECGIWGVYLKDTHCDRGRLPELLYLAGNQLQHRGQLSAGIAVFDPLEGIARKLRLRKEVGLVNDLYLTNDEDENKHFLKDMHGLAGIGHVRYSTSGTSKGSSENRDQAQPFLRQHARGTKKFAISFNGNLANYDELKKGILSEGYDLETDVDTEIIMDFISNSLHYLSKRDPEGNYLKPNLFEVYENVMKKLDGAYNVLTLSGDGDLVCFRDPQGFRPLVYGENKDMIAFASESVALRILGIKEFKDVPAGSCLVCREGKLEEKVLFDGRKAACHFEKVYFSRPDSKINGQSVYSSRFSLGQKLAVTDPLKEFILTHKDEFVVVPVPATAIPAAIAYAETLGLRYREALYKNGSLRGFINKAKTRDRVMFGKYGIIEELLEGKKVIVLDDSLVRGETSKRNIGLLRDAGAREIHFRSTEPPIKYPCFYGIDFPTGEELIANKADQSNPQKFEEQIAKLIGADSVHFQSEEGLIASCGERDSLCLACLNGDYPTEGGKKCAQASFKK